MSYTNFDSVRCCGDLVVLGRLGAVGVEGWHYLGKITKSQKNVSLGYFPGIVTGILCRSQGLKTGGKISVGNNCRELPEEAGIYLLELTAEGEIELSCGAGEAEFWLRLLELPLK